MIDKTYTLCGTPLYIAPEVILNRGHSVGADHWSLGVMIYEMLVGDTPFYKEGMDQISLYRAIVTADFVRPPTERMMSKDATKIIKAFLVPDPAKRLGALAGRDKDILGHPWFQPEINFAKLRRKEIRAPWVPKIKDPLDVSNFERWDHLEDKTKTKYPKLGAKDQAIFKGF